MQTDTARREIQIVLLFSLYPISDFPINPILNFVLNIGLVHIGWQIDIG